MDNTIRLLVIEDAAHVRQFLSDCLVGFCLVFATCQREAVDQLECGSFDLALLDLRIPRTKSDMKPNNEVGIDVLRYIRTHGLKRRNSTAALPVIVMTAYGSEDLAPELIAGEQADDYIRKPFGTISDLERKIKRALAGEVRLAPATSNLHSAIQMAFHPLREEVCIEEFRYVGASYRLLQKLFAYHDADRERKLAHENYRYISGTDLATALGISENATRKRISMCRKRIEADFLREFGRAIHENDVIENLEWKGYRLNPKVVLVAWDQLLKLSE